MGDDKELEEALAAEKRPLPTPAEKKEAVDMVPAEDNVYAIMERRDEEQILAELQGLPSPVLEDMIYSFEQGGEGGSKTVTGLSWEGVKTLALELGHFKVEDLKISETPDEFRIVVKVTDTHRGVTLYASSDQPKTMKRRDGNGTPDQFALQKAMSKAQRNGLLQLLPPAMVAAFTDRCIAAKKEAIDKIREERRKRAAEGRA